jgi:hypothetical protein
MRTMRVVLVVLAGAALMLSASQPAVATIANPGQNPSLSQNPNFTVDVSLLSDNQTSQDVAVPGNTVTATLAITNNKVPPGGPDVVFARLTLRHNGRSYSFGVPLRLHRQQTARVSLNYVVDEPTPTGTYEVTLEAVEFGWPPPPAASSDTAAITVM